MASVCQQLGQVAVGEAELARKPIDEQQGFRSTLRRAFDKLNPRRLSLRA